jgi:hypothetical protein
MPSSRDSSDWLKGFSDFGNLSEEATATKNGGEHVSHA